MHACGVAGLLTKWNVIVGQMRNLSMVQCTSPCMHNVHIARNYGFSQCRYYFRPVGEDKSTFYSCLYVRQQFEPDMLLLNSCQNPTAGISYWCSALADMFKSFAKNYNFLTASSARYEKPVSLCTCESMRDFSCHNILCSQLNDAILWCLMKCTLLSCLPKSSTDDFLTYFSIMRQPYIVGRNSNSRCLSQQPDKDSSQKPSPKQLHDVQQIMISQIPDIFLKSHDYRIYIKDVVLENNWNTAKPRKIVGIAGYVLAVLKIRFYFHCKYPSVKVAVLNSTVDESLGCVHIHWRISFLAQKMAFMFWKYAFFQFREIAEDESQCLEGRSTFYINNKGLIYKHVLDRMLFDIKKDNADALKSAR